MPNNWIDRTGHVYGDLTVVSVLQKTTTETTWNCQCICGTFAVYRGSTLTNGGYQRCRNCWIHSIREDPKDLIGKTFGLFAVEDYLGREHSQAKQHMWLCKCECGKYSRVRQSRLLNGEATGCKGCSRATHPHDKRGTNEYFLFVDAKSRAKKYNMEFTISLEDIVIPDLCPALGIPLERKIKRPIGITKEEKQQGIKYRLNDNSASLDRIDSTKDYIKGNVWVVSARANRIKNNSTPGELELIAQAVRRKQAA